MPWPLCILGADMSNIYFIGAPAQSYSEYSELDNGALKIFLSPFYFDRPAVVYGVVSVKNYSGLIPYTILTSAVNAQ